MLVRVSWNAYIGVSGKYLDSLSILNLVRCQIVGQFEVPPAVYLLLLHKTIHYPQHCINILDQTIFCALWDVQ